MLKPLFEKKKWMIPIRSKEVPIFLKNQGVHGISEFFYESKDHERLKIVEHLFWEKSG